METGAGRVSAESSSLPRTRSIPQVVVEQKLRAHRSQGRRGRVSRLRRRSPGNRRDRPVPSGRTVFGLTSLPPCTAAGGYSSPYLVAVTYAHNAYTTIILCVSVLYVEKLPIASAGDDI